MKIVAAATTVRYFRSALSYFTQRNVIHRIPRKCIQLKKTTLNRFAAHDARAARMVLHSVTIIDLLRLR